MVLAANDDVLLGLLELLGLLLLSLVLALIGLDGSGLVGLDNLGHHSSRGLANLRNLVELGLVNPLVAITQNTQACHQESVGTISLQTKHRHSSSTY